MTFEELYLLIRNLAKSQGSYGRLLETIDNMDEEELTTFKRVIKEKNFKDAVDFIMWIEA